MYTLADSFYGWNIFMDDNSFLCSFDTMEEAYAFLTYLNNRSYTT